MKAAFYWIAALAVAGGAPVEGQPGAADADAGVASQRLVSLVADRPLELTYNGRTVAVMGRLEAGAQPCTPNLVARGLGKTREWRRTLDVTALAWTGEQGAGRHSLVFYNPATHLAGDSVSVTGDGADEVIAAATALAQACQAQDVAARPVLVDSAGAGGPRSCRFRRLPGLTLIEAGEGGTQPPRAMLTLYARQSPAGELTILAEGTAMADQRVGWGRASVEFVFADPAYKSLGVTGAGFALDGVEMDFGHSLAAFGDTRVRVATEAFGAARQASAGPSFFDRLAPSRTVTLSLLDGTGQARRRLDFDVSEKLSTARALLDGAGWSCAGALPAEPPPARWEGPTG